MNQTLVNIKQKLVNYIQNNADSFRSPNIETEKTPHFLVYTSKGNDRETLNMYFGYRTSRQFINREFFSLGHWLIIPNRKIRELEALAVATLRGLGIEATRAKETYQSEEGDL